MVPPKERQLAEAKESTVTVKKLNLKEQWTAAASEEGKLAFLAQFAGVGHPLDHWMFGCSLEELDFVADKAGFALIWIRGGSHGMPDEPDGPWRRAACVARQYAYLHPARTVHVAQVKGWTD